MHFGYEPGTLLADADLVVVLESDVPWMPHLLSPAAGVRIAHVGEDPFYVRYPMRSFPSDLAVQAGVVNALAALSSAVEQRLQMAEARIAARRGRLAERMRNRRAQLVKDSAAGERISPEYLSRCIGECVGEDAVIFNEYPLRADHCPREKAGTFYALGPAGGLGWGFGAALGATIAAPDKLVVAKLGDGADMFSNPTVGHWVSQVHNLPILTIVFNNSRYGAVRNSTMAMFKDGVAGELNGQVLADLSPAPPYDEMARAQGAHAERVEKPADLPAALERARDAVVKDKRQALVNVITPY
jgi:acetolactate synthase-1/2/3 large subunit